jgi:hypothetical protein
MIKLTKNNGKEYIVINNVQYLFKNVLIIICSLYIKDLFGSITRPVKELKDFTKLKITQEDLLERGMVTKKKVNML